MGSCLRGTRDRSLPKTALSFFILDADAAMSPFCLGVSSVYNVGLATGTLSEFVAVSCLLRNT